MGSGTLLIKAGESILTVCQSVSVGVRHQLSICSVSSSEEVKEWVMMEQIDENGKRQQEKKGKDQS